METNRQWKQVPFDLELAAKIQSGTCRGRIYCKNGIRAEIAEFKLEAGRDDMIIVYRAKIDSTDTHYYLYTGDGFFINKEFIDEKSDRDTSYDLIIELVEEAPKHEFKPYEKVLVRQDYNDKWMATYFSHLVTLVNGVVCYGAGCNYWGRCIPYEGNEHLVGTKLGPEEKK